MKVCQKIMVLVVIGSFFATSITTGAGMYKSNIIISDSINEKLSEEKPRILEIPIDQKECSVGNIWVYGWDPYDVFEVDPFHLVVEYYGKEWDNVGSRDCWEYKFKFMWSYNALNLDGEYSDNPFYLAEIQYWPVAKYGCWEGESFKYGGYNVQDFTPSDFSPWADLLAEAMVGALGGVVGFPFSSALQLVKALGKTPEEEPTYTWLSKRNVYDVFGCFEYDFHVPPDTTFRHDWLFKFGANGAWDTDGWGVHLSDWHSPPGLTEIKITPSTYDFGTKKIGSESYKTFTYTNIGEFEAKELHVGLSGISDFQISGGTTYVKTLSPEESKTVEIKFTPTHEGHRSAILGVGGLNFDGVVEATITGSGEKKARTTDVNYEIFLKGFFKSRPLLEKLLRSF